MEAIYIVLARRWGDDESHSYIIGGFSNKYKAQKAAIEVHKSRGGKYECEIIEMNINEGIQTGVKDVLYKDICYKHLLETTN